MMSKNNRRPRQKRKYYPIHSLIKKNPERVTAVHKKTLVSAFRNINLHFEDSGQWYSLPEWTQFFIAVGKLLTSASNMGTRILTAIVVPTRSFGAAFVSLGMVINNASTRDRAIEAAHFEKLFDLPTGTPVIYCPQPGKAMRGTMQSPEEIKGKFCIRIKVHSGTCGDMTYILDESSALKVYSGKHSKNLGSKLKNEFVEHLIGVTDPVQLGIRSKIVCTIIGKKNLLEQEIRQTPLAIHLKGHRYIEGKLQDVLRVNKFVTPKQTHRSVLVAMSGDPPSSDVINNTEIGVVYDGASGFMKWGNLWCKNHQVVILDRTEPYFDDAVNAINNRYLQNSIQVVNALPLNEVPPGVEALSFREKHR